MTAVRDDSLARARFLTTLLLAFAVIWQVYAMYLNSPLLFPSFTAMLEALVSNLLNGELPARAWSSLRLLLVGYAIGKDWLEIVFEDRAAIYRYSYKKPGRAHVMRMIALAKQGDGLASYINQHVKANYETKRVLSRITG